MKLIKMLRKLKNDGYIIRANGKQISFIDKKAMFAGDYILNMLVLVCEDEEITDIKIEVFNRIVEVNYEIIDN